MDERMDPQVHGPWGGPGFSGDLEMASSDELLEERRMTLKGREAVKYIWIHFETTKEN